MSMSHETRKIYSQICKVPIKMGELKQLAKRIKRNHDMALELWAGGDYYPRLFSVLIMDYKALTQPFIERLIEDLTVQNFEERNQITEWLLANQLMKNKATVRLLETWENHPQPLLQRLFWYYQARLRWTGQIPPDNTGELLHSLEEKMADAKPEVQWAMNFCAGQIGVREPEFQSRCIALGEKIGLYKYDPVSKGCTPNYLPEFIRIEYVKLHK